MERLSLVLNVFFLVICAIELVIYSGVIVARIGRFVVGVILDLARHFRADGSKIKVD